MNETYYLVGGTESTLGVDITRIVDSLLFRLQLYIPDCTIEWVPLDKVQQGLRAKTTQASRDFSGALAISLSSLYAPQMPEISCNRVVDDSGTSLGVSERPGSPPLAAQVAEIRALGKPIILVDDTLFHAETACLLMQMGLPVVAMVAYFADTHGTEVLESLNVHVYTVTQLVGYRDVLPVHDFLPFMPLCGKVVGTKNGVVSPMISTQGWSYSLPYIMPFITPAQMERWACIPQKHALPFSIASLQATMAIACLLEEQAPQVGDILRLSPYRTSVPFFEWDDECLHQRDLVCVIKNLIV